MSDNCTAYEHGFHAHMAGAELDTNPYQVDSKEDLDWQRGWWDREEHMRDRDEAFLHTFGHRW